ncbi:putative inactive serine/threonine-protein kinase fnkC [Prunus yedoensis var. nudiflora]|uniref:Putative inactive serine/threonine-protein kinase fnkC n=1 Tax=Prunus yedoensis var. nudiflora TaxID=2094558 RepID=A0A314XV20_PRUYE|nr:putative inactive serine/threonine-protein kinase fnkC [Prunus yedoensis var. nudiflora]
MRTYKRDASPHHFKLEIKSYSSLSTTLAKKYESNAFEAGGHKWRLSLYPNQMINGHCYISLYLATAKSSVPSWRSISSGITVQRSLMSKYHCISGGGEVYATFRLFVFDQKQQKYFTVEDGAGTLSLFDNVTTEVGFAKFLPRDTFEHPSEGYLLNDCCTFGAEVFVNTDKRTIYEESLSRKAISLFTPRTFRYDLVKFSSQFGLEHLFPNLITVGGRNWQLCVYPKGYGQDKDISLSLYLRSADDLYTLPSVYVEFNLRVVDRAFNLHHIERTGKHWFVSSDSTFGWSDFMPLRTLNDPSKGFLRDDILSVVVEMLVKHGS